jgi:hypothetical protein
MSLSILFIAREYDNDLGEHKVIHKDAAERLIVSAAFDCDIQGYTMVESSGVWEGCREQGFVLFVASPQDANVQEFAAALRDSLSQRAVLFVTARAEVVLT